MTMNNHWGYNKYDDNWKSSKDLVQKLVDIASKGGNFLLNIGPKADGTFPDESIERLKAMGDWMDIYSESIYETSASPFSNLEWGRCTKKQEGRDTRLYLHVFEWPDDNRLVVPAFDNKIKNAFIMDGMVKTGVERQDGQIIIDLPDEAPDEYSTVIILDVKGNL